MYRERYDITAESGAGGGKSCLGMSFIHIYHVFFRLLHKDKGTGRREQPEEYFTGAVICPSNANMHTYSQGRVLALVLMCFVCRQNTGAAHISIAKWIKFKQATIIRFK
jgi:hypothetical protein